MISVCIPIYNFDVRSLVSRISEQAESQSALVEIILIDDGSDEFYREINREICSRHKYIELSENIGRSAIRNKFLKYVSQPWLLFLDCDSLIISENFLQRYLSTIENRAEEMVVCGGRVYSPDPPGKNRYLRWKYGIFRESRTANERARNPNKSFLSNNFLISGELFSRFPFDERISEYGHEDTLFGYHLKKNNISIRHIDNPVLNGDIETNAVFLEKTRKSIMNLRKILEYVDYDPAFSADIGLMQGYFKIAGIEPFFRIFFIIVRPFIVFSLKRGWVTLWMFDIYKLGIFVEAKPGEIKKPTYVKRA